MLTLAQAMPVVMVKNEAVWITAVLRPLLAVFGRAWVADTGSTDGTRELARKAGATVFEYGPQTPAALGQVRAELGQRAVAQGYPLAFQVDGDELYCVHTLRHLLAQALPQTWVCGFTTMNTLDYAADTQTYWELNDIFSRAAVWPGSCRHVGEYPFETPEVFNDRSTYHYFGLPPGYRFHALHLHRLVRSQDDAAVLLRQQKQYQFSMQTAERPRLRPFDLNAWLGT